MRVKGLRDIKTAGYLRKQPDRGDFRSQSSLEAAQKSGFTSRVQTNEPKTWVFCPKPKFTRYQKTLLVNRVRDPNTEVFEEAKSVIVIAELPGVQREEDILLHVEGDVFILEATSTVAAGNKKFLKEVLIPFQIDPDKLHPSLNNGIMEIVLYPLVRSDVCEKGLGPKK